MTVAGASIGASVLFFLVTNFAVWLTSPFYTPDFQGLMACYTAGLPFLKNGLAGDLFYTTVFFGSFYLAGLRYPVLKPVPAK